MFVLEISRVYGVLLTARLAMRRPLPGYGSGALPYQRIDAARFAVHPRCAVVCALGRRRCSGPHFAGYW